mgnify:CR=1 FL=1
MKHVNKYMKWMCNIIFVFIEILKHKQSAVIPSGQN